MQCSCRQGNGAGPSGHTGAVLGRSRTLLGERDNPAFDLSEFDSGLVERSPGAGVSIFQPIP